MKIADLFLRDVARRIEEVVKVDLGDDAVIADELDEYIATDHILNEFETVLDAYQESINDPSETCTVWVSGFFGSGKSSWAKMLGYLLWNPAVADSRAADLFFARTSAPRLQALLNTIHSQSPTVSVLLNLATGSNVVAREGESIVLAVYRALLESLGYSRNFTIAELEYTLESDGKLKDFEQAFESITGNPWKERSYTALAKREAMKAVDAVYGSSDHLPAWARQLDAPDIDADWFADRALELLERRGAGAQRLVFVVDEAGQYVSRSVQRMLDLQGVAEAFQKRRGRLWLVVTSQERLGDVVDSLESKQIELARAQARFPLRVDMLPSDIDEVTGKRILEKTADGQRAVREALLPHRHKLTASVRLKSPTRSDEPSEEELVRLYPLLPYQIGLLIDAVSARRAQGGSSPTVGGSNRTLIKHAQQLITHLEHGLGRHGVGALATLDLSYELLEELIPTSWRAEIEQVADRHGANSMEAKVMKVVALCADVPALPLVPANLAALLHPGITSESLRSQVDAALVVLVDDDRLRESEGGYKLQSPEQKSWERTRRGVGLSPGASTRLRRILLKQALGGLTVSHGRAFKVEVTADGEKIVAGDLALHIDEANPIARQATRDASRESANADTVHWVYELSQKTWDALEELHRSRAMIERSDTPDKTAADVELIAEERERERRNEQAALNALTQDLTSGQVVFRGMVNDANGKELRSTAQRLLQERLEDIFPQLEQFTADLRREDALQVLRSTDLATLPESLTEDGIGLIEATTDGYRFTVKHGPLRALLDEVHRRADYGQETTGGHLEAHFAAPPYGAKVEVVQALCAAGLRSGLMQIRHQGQRIADPEDARLDQVFRTLPRFRAAAVEPPPESDIPLDTRADLAEKLQHQGGSLSGHTTAALADCARHMFAPQREIAGRVAAALHGLGIAVPRPVERIRELSAQLTSDDDIEVVSTAHRTWADLIEWREATAKLANCLDEHIDELRAARSEANRSPADLTEEMAQHHAELVELLDGAYLADHTPKIADLTRRIAEFRETAAREAAERLTQTIGELRQGLRGDFNDIDAAAFAEALRPLEELAPPANLADAGAAALTARIDSAQARADEIRRQLEEMRAAGNLTWISIGELASGPINTEEDIESLLNRIREAIAAALADGRTVHLR